MGQTFDFHSLVCITVWGGGEVDLHDHLELCVVAAVLEGGVVVVTAKHVGLVVCEAWAVKAEVVTPFVVRVGFAHSVMSWEGCSVGEDKNQLVCSSADKETCTQFKCSSWPLRQKLCLSSSSEPLIRFIDGKLLLRKYFSAFSCYTAKS